MINKFIGMGRICNDLELRQTSNGTMVLQFTLAIERDYKDQNGERQSDFLNCVVWRELATMVSKYFSKGRMIAIEGNLRTRSYNDTRHPEVKHYVTEIYVDKVSFTGEKKDDNGGGNYQQQSRPNNNAQQQQPQVNLDDFEEVIGEQELPF